MNSTDYQVNLLRERIRELETRMLQLEDRVVFHPPAQRKPLPEDQLLGIWNKAITQDNGRGSHLSNQPFVHIARAIEAAHGIKENT